MIIEQDAYPEDSATVHSRRIRLKYFNEELTGPEYAQRFIDKAAAVGVETLFNTTAIRIDQDVLVCVNTDGILKIKAGAIILAMGCRERTGLT